MKTKWSVTTGPAVGLCLWQIDSVSTLSGMT
jgi:hypothetical protein